MGQLQRSFVEYMASLFREVSEKGEFFLLGFYKFAFFF